MLGMLQMAFVVFFVISEGIFLGMSIRDKEIFFCNLNFGIYMWNEFIIGLV